MFFLQRAPTTNCPRRKLPRRQLKPRRPRPPRKVATDGWRSPSGKRWKRRENLRGNHHFSPQALGKSRKTYSATVGNPTLSLFFFPRYFNYHFLLHSVCWFGHRTGMIHSCDENILVWLFQHVETTKSFNWLMLRVPKV